MKKLLIILVVLAVAVTAILAGNLQETRIFGGNAYQVVITTDKQNYLPGDTVTFTVHVIETDNSNMSETNEVFGYTEVNTQQGLFGKLYDKSANAPVSITTSAIPSGANGNYTVTVTAIYFVDKDTQASRSIGALLTIHVSKTAPIDTTPPSITMKTPSNSAYCTPNTQPELWFSEPVKTLTSANFAMQEGTSTDITNPIPSTIEQVGIWVTLKPNDYLKYGVTYTIFARDIQDLSGNVMPSETWSFMTMRDTVKPVVDIISPTTSASYNSYSLTYTISGTASDLSGIDRVEWKQSSPDISDTKSGTASGTTAWSFTTTPFSLISTDENYFTVTAYDIFGNWQMDDITIYRGTIGNSQIAVDMWDSASNTLTFNHPVILVDSSFTVHLNGTAWSDDYGIVKVSWNNTLTGDSGTAWSGNPTNGHVQWSADVPLKYGHNRIDVTCVNQKGGSNFISVDVSCTYVLPTPQPAPPSPTTDSLKWFRDTGIIISIIIAGIGVALNFIAPKPIKTVGKILIVFGVAVLVIWVLIISISPVG